jgi:hypothetical protein
VRRIRSEFPQPSSDLLEPSSFASTAPLAYTSIAIDRAENPSYYGVKVSLAAV